MTTVREKAEGAYAAAKRIEAMDYDENGLRRLPSGYVAYLEADRSEVLQAYLALEPVVEELVEAMKKIADYPGWCRRNIPKGHTLDGQWVVRAAELPSTYINIAAEALSKAQALLGKESE